MDEVVFVEASCRCGFYFVHRGYTWFLHRGERDGELPVNNGKAELRSMGRWKGANLATGQQASLVDLVGSWRK